MTVDLARGAAPPRPRPLGYSIRCSSVQPLSALATPAKIAGRRMTVRAGRAVEVALPGLGVAGLQVGDVDAAASAGQRRRLGFLVVDEGDDGGEVGVAES